MVSSELVGGILGSCCVEWLPGLGSGCGARTGTADQHGATSSLRGMTRIDWWHLRQLLC